MLTTKQVTRWWIPNPTGKGGFQDHPEFRNPGGRPKNIESVVWWMRKFLEMTKEEFENWKKNQPPGSIKIAAEIAWERVKNAKKKLPDFREVVDRAEGRPVDVSKIDLTSDNKPINFSIVIENGKNNQASSETR